MKCPNCGREVGLRDWEEAAAELGWLWTRQEEERIRKSIPARKKAILELDAKAKKALRQARWQREKQKLYLVREGKGRKKEGK